MGNYCYLNTLYPLRFGMEGWVQCPEPHSHLCRHICVPDLRGLRFPENSERLCVLFPHSSLSV